MKKLSLGAALVSAMLFSMGASAQTTGATGTINFNGNITADSCLVSAAGSAGTSITIPMGDVSLNAVGTQAAPASSPSFIPTTAVPVALDLRCASGTKVSMILNATNRVGTALNSIGLEPSPQQAGNVAVSLYRARSAAAPTVPGALIALSATATAPALPTGRVLEANLSGDGRASLAFEAYYTKIVDADPVTAGVANAVATYELRYE